MTGTALAGYKTPLKAFLYAAVILNKGKYGLSTLVLGQKMNVTTVTSNKIIQRLGALNREGMGYILGPYAPKYSYKVTVVSGYSALLAPDLPDVDCSNSAKVMPADALIKPEQTLYVEKSPLANKFYFDEAAQKVKIKRGFPVLDNFARQSESACESLVSKFSIRTGSRIARIARPQLIPRRVPPISVVSIVRKNTIGAPIPSLCIANSPLKLFGR